MIAGNSSPIRLALVDDHQMVRVGLRTLLEAVLQFEVIGEAATAAEALELLPKLASDVVLLDMRLPDGSGLEVCRQLRRLCPQVRVLMLTSYYNDDMVMDAIQAGAEGYLLKEINAELLIRSIREVMEGKSILDPAMTRKVIERERSTLRLGLPEVVALICPADGCGIKPIVDDGAPVATQSAVSPALPTGSAA